MKTPVDLVVLAGGTGARLWPLSRAFAPKQLLRLSGTGSMVAETIASVSLLPDVDVCSTTIITSERYADELANTLAADAEMTGVEARVLSEPLTRGTAFATMLTIAMLDNEAHSESRAQVVVLPSHIAMIRDVEWEACVREALQEGAADRPVALRYPACGLPSGTPSYALAGYPDVLLNVLAAGHEDGQRLADICTAMAQLPTREWTGEAVRDVASSIEPMSLEELVGAAGTSVSFIDTPPPELQLHDLSALQEMIEADSDGNVRTSPGIDVESSSSVVYGAERLVATLGLSNVSVIDTPDALLVADNDSLSEVRKVTEALSAIGAEELTFPRESRRPWGSWSTVARGPRFHIKTICVSPGRRLSAQSHQHRSEHWIVVRGRATVHCDGVTSDLDPGSSTYVPAGSIHRLSNEGSDELEVVEVQVGSYLGEDDIVRHDDDFRRA